MCGEKMETRRALLKEVKALRKQYRQAKRELEDEEEDNDGDVPHTHRDKVADYKRE